MKTPPESKVYNKDKTKVYIATTSTKNKTCQKNVELIHVKAKDKKIDLNDLSKKLYELGVNSILIEAGGILNGAFLKEKLIFLPIAMKFKSI